MYCQTFNNLLFTELSDSSLTPGGGNKKEEEEKNPPFCLSTFLNQYIIHKFNLIPNRKFKMVTLKNFASATLIHILLARKADEMPHLARDE